MAALGGKPSPKAYDVVRSGGRLWLARDGERRTAEEMYATICRYEGVSGTPEELARAERCLGSTIGRVPGLVATVVIDFGPAALVTVGIFEDEASLKAAERMVAVALAESPSRQLPDPPEVTTGEVVYQKGL